MSLSGKDQAQAEAIAHFVVDEIARAVAPLRSRIIEIEQRGVEYCGIFQRAVGYRRGSIVTFQNNMFAAIVDTQPNEQPLESKNWQLCLKGTHEPHRRYPNGKDLGT